MIREFGLSIKFRWSGGGEKMEKGSSEASDVHKTEKIGFPRPRTSRKLKKWLSGGSDEQKTRKNSFPRARMSRKQEKMAFRGLG